MFSPFRPTALLFVTAFLYSVSSLLLLPRPSSESSFSCVFTANVFKSFRDRGDTCPCHPCISAAFVPDPGATLGGKAPLFSGAAPPSAPGTSLVVHPQGRAALHSKWQSGCLPVRLPSSQTETCPCTNTLTPTPALHPCVGCNPGDLSREQEISAARAGTTGVLEAIAGTF